MGTSDPTLLRQIAALRSASPDVLASIAADARDAKEYSEIIVKELRPDALEPKHEQEE